MEISKKTKFDIAVITRVKRIRQEKGYSQETIAEILHVSRRFIGQVETPSHSSRYNLNHLNRIAFELECSPKDFMPDEAVKESEWGY